jgi:hypothetical protein
LKFNIPELKAVVNEIQHCGFIGGIENRPAKLNLYCSFEFICGKLIGKVDKNIAIDSFGVAKDMVCPNCIIHELI